MYHYDDPNVKRRTQPVETPADLMRFERRIEQKAMEIGRELYRKNVQPVVDGMPHVGSDGAPLT